MLTYHEFHKEQIFRAILAGNLVEKTTFPKLRFPSLQLILFGKLHHW